MSLIPLIIFIALVLGRTNRDNRNTEAFKFFIFAFIAIVGIGVLLSNPFTILAIIGIIIYLIKQAQKKQDEKKRAEKYGWDPHRWDKEKGNTRTYQQSQKKENSTSSASAPVGNKDLPPLPSSLSKRKAIIKDFNKTYNLCLTDEQIQSIANSSYMSEIWHREVQCMNRKYNVVYEWFPGYTQWLRVYMYVFHVQEITSDMKQQENIAMYAFEEVFRFADTLPDMTTAEKIERVNSQFFTSFDDATFMIAYRFLESKGLKHKLSGPDIVQNEDEMDELLKKYRTGSETGQ